MLASVSPSHPIPTVLCSSSFTLYVLISLPVALGTSSEAAPKRVAESASVGRVLLAGRCTPPAGSVPCREEQSFWALGPETFLVVGHRPISAGAPAEQRGACEVCGDPAPAALYPRASDPLRVRV